MPKTRKKKNQHKDFQKVKFKVGKKLPKGENVTNTSFRSRSIQIKDQLKTGDPAEASTKRKQNLKVLLSQLQHYSASVRHDAVSGLRELAQSHLHTIQSNIGVIIERVCELFVDKDSVIRQAVVKFLRYVFPNISANQISPFFPVFSVHLRCAMTHIYDDIQLDSLSVLDLCLEFYPKLTANDSNELLQNFLEQISKQQNKISGSSRSLNINPNSKTSTQKWRTKVLQRLHRFLLSMKNTSLDVEVEKETVGSERKWVNENQLYYLPLPEIHVGAGFKFSSGVSNKSETSHVLSDVDKLKSFISTIVPILIECWIESSPAELTSHLPGSAVPTLTLDTMCSVMRLLQILWQCVELQESDEKLISVLKEMYQKDFIQHFMPHFPFSVHEGRKGSKKSAAKQESSQETATTLNLALCDVMSYFMTEEPAQERTKWQGRVVLYVAESLQHQKLSTELYAISLGVTRRLNTKLSSDILMDAAFQAYKGSHPLSAEKRLLLEFFSENSLITSCKNKRTDIVKEWLTTLPILLLQVKTSSRTLDLVLTTIHRLVSRGNQDIIKTMEKVAVEIFNIKDGLFVSCSEVNRRRIIDILFWLPEINTETMKCLTHCLPDQRCCLEIVNYALQILHQRFLRLASYYRPVSYLASSYFSFLVSMLLGYSKEELTSIDFENETSQECCVINYDMPSWERQRTIASCVCNNFRQLPEDFPMWEILEPVTMKTLELFATLPMNSVTSILFALTNLHPNGTCVESKLLRQMANMCSDSMLVLVTMEASVAEYKLNAWRVIITTLEAFSAVLILCLENIKNGITSENARTYGAVLLKLLKEPRLQLKKDWVQTIMQRFEIHLQNDIQKQQLADLRYAASLLQ